MGSAQSHVCTAWPNTGAIGMILPAYKPNLLYGSQSSAKASLWCRIRRTPPVLWGLARSCGALEPMMPETKVATIILNENFRYVYCETPDGSSVEMQDGVLNDERVNPNSFVKLGMQPILDTLRHILDSIQVDQTNTPKNTLWKQSWHLSNCSWVEGFVRSEAKLGTGRDVVDVGSSKCVRWRFDGKNNILKQVQKAPSLTIPLVTVKCADFGIIHTEIEGPAALAQKQYKKLMSFLLDCSRDHTLMVATEGVRSFCNEAQVSSAGLSVHSLLSSSQNPLSEWHADACASDVAALEALPVVVLSGAQEGRLEYEDALFKMDPKGIAEQEGIILFVSMGGSSTQVVIDHISRSQHQVSACRSFLLGKNWFRKDKDAISATLKELGSLQAFLWEHAGANR